MTGEPDAELIATQESRRQILSSTSILGGASLIGLVLSLIRTKVFALLLGPAGVGLLGLLNNLLTSASSLAGLGVSSSGVRLVAADADDPRKVARVRISLFMVTAVLAAVGFGLLWLLREPVARHLLGGTERSSVVAWVGLGVILTMLAASQLALLNGLRRVGDIARLNILSALLGTVVGIGALLLFGDQGLLAFLLAVPLCSFVVGAWLVRRLRLPAARISGREMAHDARKLIGLGTSVMLAQLVVSLGMLAVRNLIEGRTGLASLGQFEAAWLISTVYLGAVLTAMTTDYYPRLTALGDDHEGAAALINDQTRMALWLCGPVCLAMIALAPLATLVLFSPRFTESSAILHWLVVGDVLKVMAWPLGFALLARNDGKAYLLVETIASATFVAAAFLLLPVLGLVATGAAFILMYCAYLPAVRLSLRRHHLFSWDREVRQDATLLLGCAVLTAALCSVDCMLGGATGLLLAAAIGYRNWRRLSALSGGRGWRGILRPGT